MPFQETPPTTASGPSPGRRVALVIGNARYTHAGGLRNPASDARDMARTLADLGFEVVGGADTGLDLGYGDMAARIRDFGRKLRDGNEVATALLFYAGHGLQVAGRNYLVPVDSALEYEADVGSELFELQHILNQMERPRRTSIVLLDACRNNPLARNLARAMGLGDARAAGITEGLAAQNVVAGTLIAYATQPGHVAYDGDRANGFFTEALLAHVAAPGRDVEVMLRDVRSQVVAATQTKPRGAQVPWVHSSLIGAPFYFKPNLQAPATRPPEAVSGGASLLHLAAQEWATLQTSTDIGRLKRFAQHFPGYYGELASDRIVELERAVAEQARAEAQRLQAEAERRQAEELMHRYEADWQTAEREATVAAYERFLAAWTGGPHVEAAKAKLAQLRQQGQAAAEQQAKEEQWRREGRVQVRVGAGKDGKLVWLKPGETAPRDLDSAPEMVLVPAGKFWMGAKDGEEGAGDDERPRHEVTIGAPLLVGKYAVTFAEWDAAQAHPEWQRHAGIAPRMANDHGWGRGQRPALDVSWDDAKAYAVWLSKLTGKAYRLLSDAEWEYACRAGTTTAFSFGDTIGTAQANYDGNHTYGPGSKGEYRLKTVEVGSLKAPNPFGLHDMHGNVWEWCEDPWHPDYKGAPADGSAWLAGGDTSSRVLRGGSWYDYPVLLRSAYRLRLLPDLRLRYLGFRLARTLLPSP